ncbi:MAG: MMPL family transporter [Gammaproteobacteria bacterium]|nr:MMPL family transporter [Gammaproteobacteria bacterium]
MREFEARYGTWVIRYRWAILVISVLCVLAAASGGRHLRFSNDYRIFFSPDNPQLLAFEALENTYTKNDNVMLVVEPDDGNAFSNNALAAVEWITEQAWQTPYSNRVDSLSNFQHTKAQDDDLSVGDLYSDAASLSAADLAWIKEIALAEPLLRKRLVAQEADVTAVNITVQLPGKDPITEGPEVVRFVRALAAQAEEKFPGLDVRLAGMVMMNNAFSESSAGDLQTLVPLSFALMLLLLGVLLRAVSATVTTLFVIAASILVAMGLGGYADIPISPPTASAPTIILTVAIANSVHVLVSFFQGMRRGKSRDEALVESLRLNLQPVFLASATTALGFLSMNMSEVPPFRHLGNLVAMGVGTSFVMAVTFLPALLSVLPIRVQKQESGRDELMIKLGDFVVQKRRVLLLSMSAVVVVLVAFIPRNDLNDIFLHYFDERVEFRRDSDFTEARLTGLVRIEYSLVSAEQGGVSDPEFLRNVEAFAEWYRSQPETVHVNALTDIMKRLNKNMHGDEQEAYVLPSERELAAQYLLLYEMSLPYGLDLNNQVDIDKSATRLTASLRTLSTNEMLSLEARVQDWLSANAPEIASGNGSGTALMFTHIGKRNIISMLIGTTLALVLISLVLIFALRSVRIGIISMVPNLVPAAMGFGLWGMLVGEVGLALSVVSGMTLGIVVDDTVHFLSKYLRARREQDLPPADAVRYAFTSVGRALLVTSIVLAAGFLVLAASSFELNSGMGLLTVVVIVLALVADFLLLPPLLMKLEEKAGDKMVAMSRIDAAPA